MYHDHFGFYTAPFSLSPHLHFVYASGAFEETMAHLVYGLEGGEDLILITGEIGTGKTLALNNLAENLGNTYKTCLINVTQVNFRELLKMMLAELGVEVSPRADRADLLLALKSELLALRNDGQRLLVIIDEAQNLEMGTLEGVRLLTNLGPSGEQVLQIVLSGQPSLRGKIDSPELAQLRQRIRVHYHLDTLSRDEVSAYINHRLKVAGCDRPLFGRKSMSLIHALSGGIPRLVNIIADRALLAAYVDGKDKVSPGHIEADETLARSPADETVEASHAARGAESPPPIVESRDERPAAPVKPPIRKSPAAEEPAGMQAPAAPKPAAPMATPRPARLSGRLLSVAAIVVLAALATVIFWPYLSTLPLPGRNRPETVASALPDSNRTVADDPADPDSRLASRPAARADTTAAASILPAGGTDAADLSGTGADTLRAAVNDPGATDEPIPDAAVEPRPTPDTAVETARAETPAETPAAGPVLHVGSFRDSTRAEGMADSFRARDYPVIVHRTTIDGSDWFRLYVGPFPDRDGALNARREIIAAGLTDWSMLLDRIR